MTPGPDSAPSIRRRLLALLALPAIAVLLAGTLSDYFSSIEPVRDAYDQALADGALAISAHVQGYTDGKISLVLPPEAITVLRTDAVDTVYFRVSGPGGELLAGDADLPQPRNARLNPSYQTTRFRDQRIRLVNYRSTTPSGTVTTTVAETMNKREHIRTQLLSTVLTTDLAELVAILALVWIAVSLALKPLTTLRDQIARRSARELEPLSADSVPLEVRTLVDALNRLFRMIGENSRAQRQFLENATHQLRTPLAGIQAQLELLIADEPEHARRARLALTFDATRRLSHTTQQLLALARSENAVSAYSEFRVVDLAHVAESSVADHVSRAVAADIDLGAELQPAPVHGIAWLLAEAVNNLVDNAITYTPAGGSITVRCGGSDGKVFIEIVDSGIGIPPEERERVVGRFYRGKLSRGAGSGLGLAIVADVAHLHSAALTVVPGPDGRGTVVRMEFDAAPGGLFP
ncbi:MAG TPA: sensor histidine kinase [Steroidobacteraceae bacterium]|nr:sensor histidine kinase [Steroidobacteraceae bacterium]